MVVKSDAPPTPERHMAYLIDRLEVALENALNERDFAADTVRNITALDLAPVVHARWKNVPHVQRSLLFFCSKCGTHSHFKTQYCSNCRARMDGDADDD